MIENFTYLDIVNNATGIAMIALMGWYFYKQNQKKEEDISKLKDERYENMKADRDAYKNEFKNAIEKFSNGIDRIANKIDNQ